MGYPKLSLITYNNNDKMLASREDGRKGRITLVPSNVCLYFSPVFDNKINSISFLFLMAHFTQCAFWTNQIKNLKRTTYEAHYFSFRHIGYIGGDHQLLYFNEKRLPG